MKISIILDENEKAELQQYGLEDAGLAGIRIDSEVAKRRILLAVRLAINTNNLSVDRQTVDNSFGKQ